MSLGKYFAIFWTHLLLVLPRYKESKTRQLYKINTLATQCGVLNLQDQCQK